MSKNYYNSYNEYGDTSTYQGNCVNTEINGSDCGNDCNNNHNWAGGAPYVIGNSVDFIVGKCDSEIKADLTVGYRDTVRVWGQIKDCNGKPVPYAYLKLIKINKNGQEGVAHTITDCLGYYQFDLCQCEAEGINYRLLVGKASVGGGERTISSGISGTNCNLCSEIGDCNCR